MSSSSPATPPDATRFEIAVQLAARRQSRRLREFRFAIGAAERDAYHCLAGDDHAADHDIA